MLSRPHKVTGGRGKTTKEKCFVPFYFVLISLVPQNILGGRYSSIGKHTTDLGKGKQAVKAILTLDLLQTL